MDRIKPNNHRVNAPFNFIAGDMQPAVRECLDAATALALDVNPGEVSADTFILDAAMPVAKGTRKNK